MARNEYTGAGSIVEVKNILDEHRPKKIFFVTGKSSYKKSGAQSIINKVLKNYKNVHYNDFNVNPKFEDLKNGISLFKKNNCDFVIAVGGGSTIDIAKSVNLFASNPSFPIDYIQKKKNIEKKGSTLVAIPTTAGSGSEATKFAVIYTEKIKSSIEHDFILPDYSIVDPEFTMSSPRYVTACAGMDALSQGIESYWCINSTEESKKYARESIKLAFKNLPQAVNEPSREIRESMAKAAHLAGKAINISKTTACHSISYPITSYFNVPHGHAVALTLALMIIYNSQATEKDVLDERGMNYVNSTISEIVELLGADNAEDAANKIINLMREIGLRTRLSELGINKDEEVELIIKRGFNPDRVNNNPRMLTEFALREILYKIR